MITVTSWFQRGPRTAAEWVARLHSGMMTPADHAALATWLDRKPQHRRDYEQTSAAWVLAQRLQSSAVARQFLADGRVKLAQRRSARRRPKTIVFGLATGLAAALVALAVLPERGVHTTVAGQIETVSLEDGSTVWLNGDSRLKVDFSAPVRRVVLERGEAFFKVAHDASRPFVVEAEPRRVVVTGTEFDVRRAPQSLEVSVTEGHVKVETAALHGEAAAPTTALSAGDDASFTAGQTIPAVARGISAEHKGAWHEGKLYLDDLQLSSAVDEINRYSRTKLVLADEPLQHLTISGVFKTGDTDSVLFALRELYHIEARHESGRIVLYRTGE